jgi:hypothetical protein
LIDEPEEVHRMTTKSIDKQRLSRPALSALTDVQEFLTAGQFAGLLQV